MSIRLRLTLLYSAILTVTLLAFGGLLYLRQYQDTIEIEKRFLIGMGDRFADGRRVWSVDTHKRFRVVQNFFGAMTRKLMAVKTLTRPALADESKLLPRLGRGPLPVDIVAFGLEMHIRWLNTVGCRADLRLDGAGSQYSGCEVASRSRGRHRLRMELVTQVSFPKPPGDPDSQSNNGHQYESSCPPLPSSALLSSRPSRSRSCCGI